MDAGSAHFRIEEVAPGAWAALAGETGACGSNAGIIDLGDLTMIVDTFATPEAAVDLQRAARNLTGRSPAWVVNTHHHADHVGGNRAFTGADIVATAGTIELMRQSAPPDLDITPPTRSFEGDLVVEGSERAARLITYGGGHTDSDAFVFLPDCGVIFAGDLLWVETHPWAGDGHPDEWIDIIYRMRALDPRTVVPGHGTVTDFAYARILVRYLTLVCDLLRQAKASSTPVVKLTDSLIPPQYGDWNSAGHYHQTLGALGARLGLPPD